jgi:protein-S-isoprenylcysteine O-methyltransferase Ste14
MIETNGLIIIVLISFFLVTMLFIGIILIRQKLNPFGKTPINNKIFLIGNLCVYGTWIAIIAQSIGFNLRMWTTPFWVDVLAIISLVFGLFFAYIGLLNLGKSLRMGLPEDKIDLKTDGAYGLSRNPMVLGFNLISVTAVLYTINPFVLAATLISIYIQHKTILSEEIFLRRKFGNKYKEYCKKVSRYFTSPI